MGKAPSDQFYYADFERDLNGHPLEVAGAWILILGKLWYSKTRGKLEKTLSQWGRSLAISETKTLELLRYIKEEEIGDIPTDLTNPNGKITVICRRQVRDEKVRESNRIKQRRHYYKKKPSPQPNQNLTPPSSSSSSSPKNSSSKEEQASPAPLEKKLGHFSDQIKDENIVEHIIDLCRWYDENLKTFNGWQFVQKNCQCHPEALIEVLGIPKQYIENKMPIKKGPWAIVNKILPVKIQNYNAQDTIRAHKELTEQMTRASPEVQKIASGLFRGMNEKNEQ